MVEGALEDMERAGRTVVKGNTNAQNSPQENSRKRDGDLMEQKLAVKSVEGSVATKEPYPPFVDPGMGLQLGLGF